MPLARPGLVLAALVLTASCAGLTRKPPRDLSIESFHGNGTAAPIAAPTHLRVVTYNTHGIAGRDLARALGADDATAQADLYLLQEVSAHGPCSAACALARTLGFAALYAPGHQQDGGTSGVAILSRWPLRDPEVIELPYQYAVVNSARRIALAATVETARGPLRVLSVHLENRISPEARVRQLWPALEHARAFAGHVLLGGDLNTSPFSWLWHLVPLPTGRQDDVLVAAVRSLGLETPVASSAATSKWLGMRLDAIYTRGLLARRHGVAIDVRASDHLPLWLEAELAAPAAGTASASRGRRQQPSEDRRLTKPFRPPIVILR